VLIALPMPAIAPQDRACVLRRWLRREGDRVEEGELLAEIAAGESTMEVEAPQAGVLLRLMVAPGESVAVGAPLALIEAGPLPHETHAVSPRARRLAREHGLTLEGVHGSGPGGRVVERDLAPLLAQAEPPALPVELELFRPPMLAALEWTPQAVLEAECRIDDLEAMRRQVEAAAGGRVTLVDCVLRALALALQACPQANVAQAPEGFLRAKSSDVAAVGHIDGRLAAPAIVGADKMSLTQIAAARAGFSSASLSPDTIFGGASLVANVGAYGLKKLFPVMLPPWTSILSLGVAEKRFVVENDAPTIALMISMTLTLDRRAMDEATGASLLAAVKALLENPYRLLI
jgi:pyruvate dehydrogenase E2 component (dihydrolipoamide acetyltransferase)